MGADVFSKVARRMWVDQKFSDLSAPQPSAQFMWIFLLTGPHVTSVPGLFVMGELGLAEHLNWDTEPSRACLRELIDSGMVRFDKPNRLMWLPNALRYNQPRSPKHVLGWRRHWADLPLGSPLLGEARSSMRVQLAEVGTKFARAFDRVVAGPDGELYAPDEDEPEDDRPEYRRSWSTAAYKEVYRRDLDRCRYCGASDDLSIDHVVPRLRGGTDDASNLVVACAPCNSRKGARTPEQAGMALRPVPGGV